MVSVRTLWSINSPDLTLSHLFVMVHVEEWLMCNVLLPLISLRANIVAASQHITPEMLKVAWEEMTFLLSAFFPPGEMAGDFLRPNKIN
jgi:hypothetical protein